MTQWASKKDFVAWTKSEAFRKAHSGPRAKGVIGAAPAGYEVVVERGLEAWGLGEETQGLVSLGVRGDRFATRA